MRNRIDYILIGVLWLLAATLGISFLFNTYFGFNIFSAQHWEYLSYLQASNTPIKSSFYIFIVISVIITIAGLYMLLMPRARRLRLSVFNYKKWKKNKSSAHTTTPDAPDRDASTVDILPGDTEKPVAAPLYPNTRPQIKRPPHLNIPTHQNNYMAATNTPAPSATAPVVRTAVGDAPNTTAMDAEITEIFKSAGYIIKPTPNIKGVRPSVFAIGTDEVLWIGSVGIATTDMRMAIDTLSQIFSDTLDDIQIGINGFVINAPDAATSEFEDILMFNTISDLRDYISAHPNPALPADGVANFDAYSAYISTVIDYVGKF